MVVKRNASLVTEEWILNYAKVMDEQTYLYYLLNYINRWVRVC